MKKQSLADLYKSFIRQQDISTIEKQKEADLLFLTKTLPTMQYTPIKLGQVLQKYSMNRIINNYGKKLVKQAIKTKTYQRERKRYLNSLYPNNPDNMLKL